MIRFLKCRRGATAIEYGLIAGLVSVVIVTVLTTVGKNTQTLYDGIASKMASALSGI